MKEFRKNSLKLNHLVLQEVFGMNIKPFFFRQLVHFILVTLCIFWSSLIYSADELPRFSIKFEKNGLSTFGADVVQTKDGGFLLAGRLYDVSGSNSWGWLAKISDKGKQEWQKELGKKAQNSSFGAAMIARHGQVVLAGSVHGHYENGLERSLAWLVEIDQDGRVLWDKTLSIGRAAYAVDVKSAGEDSLLVLVTSKEGSRDFISVLKFDYAGHEISKTEISLTDSVVGKFIHPFPDNSFIVSGTKFSPPDYQNKVWIAHFGEHGDLLWEHTLRDEQGQVSAGVVLPNNDILLARLDGLPGGQSSLITIDKGGNILWKNKVSVSEICGISKLWMSTEGKVLAAGANCGKVSSRMWIGEVLDNGKIRLLKKEVPSKDGAVIVRMIPMDRKFAVVLEDKADSGDTRTWLLVSPTENIELTH